MVNSYGPCNKERLDARRQAHTNGEWVRQAAMAYAEKQAAVTLDGSKEAVA